MADKQWFEEWFDSPYYHILYSNRNDAEAESFISNIVSKLAVPKASTALDAACGKGRHSKTLAKLGLEVWGTDLAANSIAEAKMYECDNLHFEVWDIRKVYKPGFFDYVFNLFSSFGYFENDEDDYLAMQAFADNLKTGGTLVIDFFNSEWVVKNIKPRDIVQRGEMQFHIKKKIENGYIIKSIDFLDKGEDHHYEERVKLVNFLRFKELIQRAGLEITGIYGDYDLNEFVPSVSTRLIITAVKK
jgi:SAM-dependent methyltransferase